MGRGQSLALRIQCLCGLLPVRTVKAPQRKRRRIHCVDAPHIDRPPGWIETWPREGMDTTVPAMVVLGSHCVELVRRQLTLSRGDAKARVRRATPQGSDSTAQRATALHDIVKLCVELERDSTAVTRTFVSQPCVHEQAALLDIIFHPTTHSNPFGAEWAGTSCSRKNRIHSSRLPGA